MQRNYPHVSSPGVSSSKKDAYSQQYLMQMNQQSNSPQITPFQTAMQPGHQANSSLNFQVGSTVPGQVYVVNAPA